MDGGAQKTSGGNRAALRRLRNWHKDLGLSQSEFAKLIGITQGGLSRIYSRTRRVGELTALKIELASGEWAHGPIRSSEWAFPRNTGDASARQSPLRPTARKVGRRRAA